ncbi:MAG: deoxyribonuclease IV [Syntrophomonadaceae bacterium]|nr:deoxyribonuclease IV [Syntrophomonadaceae bacterium]
MYLGAHLPISKGYQAAVRMALEIGGNTFQFFTRNPRGSRARALNLKDIEQAAELARRNDFGPLVGHAPYTINLAAVAENTRAFAVMVLKEDLERLKTVGASYLAVHPGNHGGQGIEKGIDNILQCLDLILTEPEGVTLLLEGMAGEGTEIGFRFEQLKEIYDGVKHQQRLGVILDTCHLYGAGYDIRDHLDAVLEEFDRIMGLDQLKALHVNDTKYPLASKRDRHTNLGEGFLGVDFFVQLVRHPEISQLPLILETPGDLATYEKEIAFLRAAATTQ